MGDRPTYIYALIDPRDRRVRYVGKTVYPAKRLHEHIYSSGDRYCVRWVHALLRHKLVPQMKILEIVDPGQDWAAREQWWIKEFRRLGCLLTNITDGGEGTFGREVTAETREKLRYARLGWHPSPDTLEKLRISHLGHRLSPESQSKRIKKIKGQKRTLETIKKISAAISGTKNGAAQLNPEKVKEIRARYKAGGVSQRSLAREYGVTRSAIQKVVNMVNWKVD